MTWKKILLILLGKKSDNTYTEVAVEDDGRVKVSGTVTTIPSGTQDVNIVSPSPVPVVGPLTDAELRASPVEVTGSLSVTGGLTDAELRASDVNVADSGEREYTHVVSTVVASGDTVVYTPSPGMRVRLRWIYAINNPTATSAPVISIRLGVEEKFRVFAISKRQMVTGPVDGELIINLSSGGNVTVTALLEEV